jgi:hypothetical protein
MAFNETKNDDEMAEIEEKSKHDDVSGNRASMST